jgi:hypothetical protein
VCPLDERLSGTVIEIEKVDFVSIPARDVASACRVLILHRRYAPLA